MSRKVLKNMQNATKELPIQMTTLDQIKGDNKANSLPRADTVISFDQLSKFMPENIIKEE